MGLKKMATVGHVRRQAEMLLMAMAAALMLSSGVALAATITCQTGVECFGTKNADTLKGTDGSDNIYGRAGADTLRGRSSHDDLYGQRGSDRLFGGLEADYLFGGPGNDELNGGEGRDLYYFPTNNWGKDSISDNTTYVNDLHFRWDERAVTEDLTIRLFPSAGPEVKNASATSTINWNENITMNVYSGNGDDTITGNYFPNTVYGRPGRDTISTLGGNDSIDVVDGELDTVDCGSGLFGGQDHDVVYYDTFDDVVSDNCEKKIAITTP